MQNDKIYVRRNKVAKKYLRIAFSAIVGYCCVLYCRVPPPEAQPTTHPTHPQNFYFFYFFSTTLAWIVFASLLVVAAVHCCLFWLSSPRRFIVRRYPCKFCDVFWMMCCFFVSIRRILISYYNNIY